MTFRCGGAKGFVTNKTMKPQSSKPVGDPVAAEILEFQAAFCARAPFSETVREGARRILQTAIDAVKQRAEIESELVHAGSFLDFTGACTDSRCHA